MVIQWTLCICLSIYTFNNALAYKVNLEAEQNEFNELLENLDKDQFRVIYSAQSGNRGDHQSHQFHHVKAPVFIGRENYFFIRNARNNEDDNILSHTYQFIKNRPHFKTINYDETIHKFFF